eukprot:349642-Chlamydomonas_euryale.AAC.7
MKVLLHGSPIKPPRRQPARSPAKAATAGATDDVRFLRVALIEGVPKMIQQAASGAGWRARGSGSHQDASRPRTGLTRARSRELARPGALARGPEEARAAAAAAAALLILYTPRGGAAGRADRAGVYLLGLPEPFGQPTAPLGFQPSFASLQRCQEESPLEGFPEAPVCAPSMS